MKRSDLRLAFLGTPQFAAHILLRMVDEGFRVVAVVTAPDKPAGRGQQLQQSDVKKTALSLGLPIFQPERLKAPEWLEEWKNLQLDGAVVVAFRMLPLAMWSAPRLGTFNLHASLLPQYRGAAPINHAIWQGENETGVTTFLLNEEIDAGSILLQRKVSIDARENAGSLHDKLMEAGAELVVETLDGWCSASLKPIQQAESGTLKVAPKIFREHLQIQWNAPAEEVDRTIRALSPYPGAFSWLDEGKGQLTQMKIYEAHPVANGYSLEPGSLAVQGQSLLVGTGTHPLAILNLQIQGKKRLSTPEFLRGYRFSGSAHFVNQPEHA
jgi:methionyl-tRNA formyltransferase